MIIKWLSKYPDLILVYVNVSKIFFQVFSPTILGNSLNIANALWKHSTFSENVFPNQKIWHSFFSFKKQFS